MFGACPANGSCLLQLVQALQLQHLLQPSSATTCFHAHWWLIDAAFDM
jgi:hypothetical protein